MKALFLIDNIPMIDIFAPVVDNLATVGISVFVNYNWSKKKRVIIDDYASKFGIRCETLKSHNGKGVMDIINQEHPDIIVLAREEATPVEKLFNIVARYKNIPTLLIPHGLLFPNELGFWGVDGKFFRLKHFYRLFKQGYRKLVKGNISINYLMRAALFRIRNDFQDKVALSNYCSYSKIACAGKAMEDILIKYGVKPGDIIVTGNPKFDYLHRNRTWMNSNPHVLLITNYLVEQGSWTERQRKEYTNDICYAAGQILNCKLIIKIHPVAESLKDYEKIIESQNFPATIYQDIPLPKMVEKCDIAITTMSSGGMEAMAAGKPLIVYNPFNNVTQYDATSGAYFAKNKEELLSVIKDIIDNGMSKERKKIAKEFVYQQAYLQDGKASKRIAKLIEEMTNGR